MHSPEEEYDLHDRILVERLNQKPKTEKKPLCKICKGLGTSEFCENCGRK